MSVTVEQIRRIVKNSNTAHEQVFTVRRVHVGIFKEMSTPAVLSRIIYWSGKSRLEDDWFYKTAKELAEETCLSERTIHNVKDKLVAMGLVEVAVRKVSGIPTLHWRLNFENLFNLEMQYVEEGESCKPAESVETANFAESETATVAESILQPLQSPILQNNTIISFLSENSNKEAGCQPEKSKEEISGKKRRSSIKSKEPFVLPGWMPVPEWEAFVEMRNKMGPFTDNAKRLSVATIERLVEGGEFTAAEVLNQSVELSWRGLFPVRRDRFGNGKKGGSRKDGEGGTRNASFNKEGNGRTDKYAGLSEAPIGEG